MSKLQEVVVDKELRKDATAVVTDLCPRAHRAVTRQAPRPVKDQ
jgi:hypothetical protein